MTTRDVVDQGRGGSDPGIAWVPIEAAHACRLPHICAATGTAATAWELRHAAGQEEFGDWLIKLALPSIVTAAMSSSSGSGVYLPWSPWHVERQTAALAATRGRRALATARFMARVAAVTWLVSALILAIIGIRAVVGDDADRNHADVPLVMNDATNLSPAIQRGPTVNDTPGPRPDPRGGT